MAAPGKTYGKLEQVFDDVWWAWGTVNAGKGVVFPRNMVLVREGGELIAIHPVLMPEEEQAKIEALGPVKHIMRLGAGHGMDDAAYVKRYTPTVWMPPGCEHSLGKTVDLVPGAKLPISEATVFEFTGSRRPETALHLARHGGVLLTCDSVQNWEGIVGLSLMAKVMTPLLGFRGRAVIGPLWRKANEPKDGAGFGPRYEDLLKLDFRHLLSAHGPPLKDTARDDLRARVSKIYKR